MEKGLRSVLASIITSLIDVIHPMTQLTLLALAHAHVLVVGSALCGLAWIVGYVGEVRLGFGREASNLLSLKSCHGKKSRDAVLDVNLSNSPDS